MMYEYSVWKRIKEWKLETFLRLALEYAAYIWIFMLLRELECDYLMYYHYISMSVYYIL